MEFSNGTCTFGQLPDGTYRVFTKGSNDDEHLALAFSRPFTLVAGETKRVTLEQGPGHLVTGWVSDENGNARQATVTVGETGLKREATASGWIELRLPRKEDVVLTFRCSGFEDATVLVSRDTTSLREIVLRYRRPDSE